MGIHIGNQTAFSAGDPLAPYRFAVAEGFTAFEWFDDTRTYGDGTRRGWCFADADAAARRVIREDGARLGIRFSVHVPWQANPLQAEGIPPLREGLAFAEAIGAAVMVLHLYPEEGARRYADSLSPVLEEARACGVPLALENTPHTSPADVRAIFEALAACCGTGGYGLCFDMGHANCCEATRNDYIRFLDELPPEIPLLHMHIHENDGGADTHWPLFSGPAGRNDAGVRALEERLRGRGFSGSLILEQWPDPVSLLLEAEGRLRGLFGMEPGAPRVDAASGLEDASSLPGSDAVDADAAAPASDKGDERGGLMEAGDPLRQDDVLPEGDDDPLVNEEDVPGGADDLLDEADDGLEGEDDPLGEGEDLPEADDDPVEVDEDSSSAEDASSTENASTTEDEWVDGEGSDERETPGIDPDDEPLLAAIVEANRTHTSWRTRLGWVRDTLLSPAFDPSAEHLAALAVYLRFLGTGEVACAEDGGHHRPNRHAAAAEAIETRLEELAAETGHESAWLLRRIAPWLPSYADPFRRSEPLTRIRDIAHRNDIPKELKQEIKHTLQNKLHRSAGPEDLLTAEALLARITAPGASHPESFVHEFRIFVDELRDFFNAPDLARRLDALRPALDPDATAALDAFLVARQKQAPRPEQFAALTILRIQLQRALHAADGSVRQQLRLADIALDQFAFPLLSAILNERDPAASWEPLLPLTEQALRQIALDGIDPDEAACLVRELHAWQAHPVDSRLHALRAKATFERARRLCEAYADQILTLFPPRVEALGHALGVPPHAIRMFCEGDLRGNLVFQLSKLVSLALHAIRTALRLPPWEAVVPGSAEGVFTPCDTLGEVDPEGAPVIVWLREAEGDEDIPPTVRGIVLAHSIPHLSHLGVRARQAGVPFAASDDPDAFDALAEWEGKHVRLTVTPGDIHLQATAATPPASNATTACTQVHIPEARCTDTPTIIPLAEIEAETCGAKAAATRRLVDLALASGGLFHAPRGVAVPFGVMEACLAEAGDLAETYAMLAASEPSPGDPGFAEHLRRLRAAIARIPIPPTITDAVVDALGADTILAVRSSANGEDLEGFAGAGLYDSVVGVRAGEVAGAIRTVWASLWTQRAARSRVQAGIDHAAIRMGVLVQGLLAPDMSFIMHTTDPVTGETSAAQAELAVGLGDVLASASEAGHPYRLRCAREGGRSALLACSSFSGCLRPSLEEGTVWERVDASEALLGTDPEEAVRLGDRLGRVASFLEEALGMAQDVEGVLCGGEIHIVQTRPQQGVFPHTQGG